MSDEAAPPAPVPPAPEPVVPPQADKPAPPPAATAVLNGKTEAELAAERRVAEAEDRAKRAETIAAEKEDELTRLKAAPAQPAPANPKKRKPFFQTLLHDPED